MSGMHVAATVCVLTLSCCACFAEGTLRRDVFAPPVRSLSAKSVNKASMDVLPIEPTVWEPRLSTVVNAGKNSMVVLNGSVLRLNDSLDGYRLIQVGLGEAVFSKGGEQIVVGMTKLKNAAGSAQAKDKQ